ncbi:23S rRNA (adenine(2030)-N(6))-methyltransferase RlmJ [Aliiglaciecola sp. LCG003]|uniref:23S rRNA (adenine(2030)-N(6))-methyltransferase RlmJ n=1 Tax=Aliiglaciecola sp. LCG003 TaxID=3053655 RepID=UPI002574708E|nr:23S rRNA (adenine(2030)-N(6))-methyltransferase RlmJ [Aliiglaciecola sp. LCG003]WJG07670.1 23S rRNA (adenine(2030)-N(6))-methyltransferase RlmJ [Aliiglaciecola sp. LCG003]
MFSYRHSFHAGNHADVLKHLTQMLIIEKLLQKNKPAIYFDTHSGGGLYDLSGEEALKTEEFRDGIGKLSASVDGSHPAISRYLDLVERFARHQQYPGSPMIASEMLREQDRMVLMEYHNTEIDNLRHHLTKGDVQCDLGIHHRDGFEGLLAMLPPTPARGLVLIDPPYEVLDEYQQVTSAMQAAFKKWPIGTYALWYPLLSSRAGAKSGQSERMLGTLSQLDAKNILSVTLQVKDNQEDSGMYGSGLLIVNAPWQLDETLQQVLPELHDALVDDPATGTYSVAWLKQPD